jgi:hypothetical protein
MGLDLDSLERVRRRGSNTIARCPACAEADGDRKGEHLFINEKGQFGCVLYPGQDGQKHRQRIFELAGVKEMRDKSFEVRSPLSTPAGPSVIQKDILGRLGHFQSNHARKSLETPICKNRANTQEDLNVPIPNVPKPKPECLSEIEPRPF